MLKLASLWIKQGKNGEFFSGKLGDATIMIFPNRKKTADNQPDFNVFLAEPQNKGYQPRQDNQPPQRPPAPAPASRQWGNKPSTPPEDDFGF